MQNTGILFLSQMPIFVVLKIFTCFTKIKKVRRDKSFGDLTLVHPMYSHAQDGLR